MRPLFRTFFFMAFASGLVLGLYKIVVDEAALSDLVTAFVYLASDLADFTFLAA